MVSYFVPRGRFLIKASNLRRVHQKNQQQEHQKPGRWPMFRQIRQSFSSKSEHAAQESVTSTTSQQTSKLNPPHSKGKSFVRPQLLQNHYNVWTKWTGFLLRWAPMGICVLGAIEWHLHKKKCEKELIPRTASEFQSMIYCSLPLRIISRCWGWFASCNIPSVLRPFVYGLYSSTFNVNMEEALDPDYKSYKSLSEFFTRPLREGARTIDPHAVLVSPADGKVLHFGSASNSLIEQVKGVNYRIESFLGPPTWVEKTTECKEDYMETIKIKSDNSTALYQCVVYLAPGDYHRFHSPTDWQPKLRRHFAGELLSVSPKIASWLPGLFCLNERAIYLGKWKHGFFSYTAVGATNVGSVQFYMDKDLKTNRWVGLNVGFRKMRKDFEEMIISGNTVISKGDLLGHFNMGSTIVLLFEAPKNFKFNIQAGQSIKVGEPLGQIIE